MKRGDFVAGGAQLQSRRKSAQQIWRMFANPVPKGRLKIAQDEILGTLESRREVPKGRLKRCLTVTYVAWFTWYLRRRAAPDDSPGHGGETSWLSQRHRPREGDSVLGGGSIHGCVGAVCLAA